MLTPEQQAQYQALLLKQYKGLLTNEEQAEMAALQLLRDAPETGASSDEVANLAPNLARLAGELDRFEADLGEMSGKIGGRRAVAEAMTELGEPDAKKPTSDHDAH
ncbi:MAG: hypothetical protein SNJ67_02485 [Chloracidobacterium sp.]|uniref:Uncharacterized protein n=1 Tax=Chloracidobacterium validum TaxID=2821543 RepID=A0ABX8B7W3_9BACT|nr:hypothetical protein [Chloracidobacterium validum]QUW02151.1 hypothetical protein J8C06_07200 [Chloracidobacterium validum]